MTSRRTLIVGGRRVKRGESHDVRIKISETFTGQDIYLPVRVIRAEKPGAVVFISAALHGDEVNGTGIIRELLFGDPLALRCGAIICAPVLNILGFESHERYMPDRRDLNRCFPGSADGSLASRHAHLIMEQIVANCDYGIDLHSAAIRRTNFPNIRGDLRNPVVAEIAEAFGCELMVNGRGPEGSLRRAATDSGCPTIVLEAGEVSKIEPIVVEIGLRGVRNVLVHLGMLEGDVRRPPYQVRVNRTHWLRAHLGGLLRFHVGPGDFVEGGQPVATNESILGQAQSILIAPFDGIVLGMTTHPAVQPGEPVCHLARPGRPFSRLRRLHRNIAAHSPETRVREELAVGIAVSPADGLGD